MTETAAWFQTDSGFAASFGGGANVARADGGDGLRYTVIPLPAVPSTDYTAQRRSEAIAISYQGRLQDAVDLYRGTVEADGWMAGILDTMAHGILGLPLSFQGDPEMCSALLDADGSAGDFRAMFPGAECAKIFRDGIGLGFGLGQFLLMCWRCGGIDMVSTDRGEVCNRCCAPTFERPFGARRLFQLRWRDARWLFRNTITRQWYYTGRQGMFPITPGDGEWFLYQTIPDVDMWRHGPWVWATLAAIFARDSSFDRQNTSAVCAPTPVFEAKGPTAPKTRKEVETQAQNLRFGNKLVLPGEWNYRIEAATATYSDVSTAIIDWAVGMFEVGITGNRMGMQAQSAFTDASVYKRTTAERRAFYAGEWIRQTREQGLVWWGRDNFGSRNVPIGSYDVRSPEDKLAESKALGEEGDALGKLAKGYEALGVELEPRWIVERAQTKGIRVRPKALASPTAPPSPEGSPSPAPPSPPLPSPAAPEAPSARLADDDEGPDAGAEEAARFAAEMTAHALDRCPHNRTHMCPRCGIRRIYSVTGKAEDGSPIFGVSWRPIVEATIAEPPKEIAPPKARRARKAKK